MRDISSYMLWSVLTFLVLAVCAAITLIPDVKTDSGPVHCEHCRKLLQPFNDTPDEDKE